MPITASVITSGRKYVDASGNSCRQKRSMPNVPTLSTTAIISTAVAGVDSAAGCADQRGACREARLAGEVGVAAAVVRVRHAKPDHRGEHDQPAEQVVQQELHRCLRSRI